MDLPESIAEQIVDEFLRIAASIGLARHAALIDIEGELAALEQRSD